MAYIIAEIGLNHNGNFEQAKQLIDAAVECGVDAVKFQHYDPKLRKPDLSDYWLSPGIIAELYNYCPIGFVVTVFDLTSLAEMEEIGIQNYKISSFNLTDTELLKVVGRTGKTVYLSTGMATLEEIKEAIPHFLAENLTLMHCVSAYPTMKPNLKAIETLKTLDRRVGYSDHSGDVIVASYAVILGSEVIESHFKINDDCIDYKVSFDPTQMKLIINMIERAKNYLGTGQIGMTDEQKPCEQYRVFS